MDNHDDTQGTPLDEPAGFASPAPPPAPGAPPPRADPGVAQAPEAAPPPAAGAAGPPGVPAEVFGGASVAGELDRARTRAYLIIAGGLGLALVFAAISWFDYQDALDNGGSYSIWYGPMIVGGLIAFRGASMLMRVNNAGGGSG